MANKEEKLDIIIFGVTGVTGRYALENLLVYIDKTGDDIKFGVAGRNKEKIDAVVEEVSAIVKKDLKSIPVFICKTEDAESVNKMCSSAKCIINVVGPYYLYGDPVVEACVEHGTHHVDISGEPQWLENIQLKYHKKAEEKGAFIVESCGYDSIPADLGFFFMKDNVSNFRMNSLEVYTEAISTGERMTVNHGTWDSAVLAIGSRNKMREIRRQLYSTFFTKPIEEPRYKAESRLLPRLGLPELNKRNTWVVPLTDIDSKTNKRSQLMFYNVKDEKPINDLQTYFLLKPLWVILPFFFMGFVLFTMSSFEYGRRLLMNYPALFSLGMFSKTGPKRSQIKATSCKITLLARGWTGLGENETPTHPPNKIAIGRITGPEMGYDATSIFMICSALILLKEPKKILVKGGVLTPGFAFRHTSFIDLARKMGINFDIVKKPEE